MARHKLIFYIEQDEDDYPPVAVETVWVSDVGVRDQYEIDNIPFYASQATLGDIVHARRLPEGLVFDHVVARSSNSLIRVIVYDAANTQDVRARLKELGCSSELSSGGRLLAVNVPGSARLETIQAYLQDLEARDIADYEEPILRQ